jgi:hypothetical protein
VKATPGNSESADGDFSLVKNTVRKPDGRPPCDTCVAKKRTCYWGSDLKKKTCIPCTGKKTACRVNGKQKILRGSKRKAEDEGKTEPAKKPRKAAKSPKYIEVSEGSDSEDAGGAEEDPHDVYQTNKVRLMAERNEILRTQTKLMRRATVAQERMVKQHKTTIRAMGIVHRTLKGLVATVERKAEMTSGKEAWEDWANPGAWGAETEKVAENEEEEIIPMDMSEDGQVSEEPEFEGEPGDEVEEEDDGGEDREQTLWEDEV